MSEITARLATPTGLADIFDDDLPILHGCTIPHPPRFAAFASFFSPLYSEKKEAG
jgi:hypothetical protein